MKLPEPSVAATRLTFPSEGRNIQRSSGLPAFCIVRNRVPATEAGFWKMITVFTAAAEIAVYWSSRRSVLAPSRAMISRRERVDMVSAFIEAREAATISAARSGDAACAACAG